MLLFFLSLHVLVLKTTRQAYFSSKQCAADSTQQESMRTPPHLWWCCLCRCWYTLMTACHGCIVMSLSRPPNMRNEGWFKVLSNRWPHVAAETTPWLNCWQWLLWKEMERDTFIMDAKRTYLHCCRLWWGRAGQTWSAERDVSLEKEEGQL